MALNPTKSVAILFGTLQRLKLQFGFEYVYVVGAAIPLSDKIKILGATLDTNHTMVPHIEAFTTFILSGRFVHRKTTRLSLSHPHLSLRAWIS